MIIIIYIIHLIKKIHHEKKQKLSKEAQEIAELYTRLEILKSKQIEGVKTTRYTTDAIRAIGDEVFGELLRGGEIDAAVGFHRGDHSRQNAAERC